MSVSNDGSIYEKHNMMKSQGESERVSERTKRTINQRNFILQHQDVAKTRSADKAMHHEKSQIIPKIRENFRRVYPLPGSDICIWSLAECRVNVPYP